MTDEQLQAIRERVAAATVGPWEADKAVVWGRRPDYPTWRPQIATTDVYPVMGDGSSRAHTDAAFIAHAHEDIPLLLTEIDRLRAILGQVIALESRDYPGDWSAYDYDEVEDIKRRAHGVLGDKQQEPTLDQLIRDGWVGEM